VIIGASLGAAAVAGIAVAVTLAVLAAAGAGSFAVWNRFSYEGATVATGKNPIFAPKSAYGRGADNPLHHSQEDGHSVSISD